MGALVAALSVGIGVGTYLYVRDALLDERQTGAVEQVSVNARLLDSNLRASGVSEVDLLASLRPQVRSRPLLQRDGEWFTASLQIQPETLPASLVELTLAGSPARQRFDAGGEMFVGVGIPLPDGTGTYFEVFSLEDLDDTLGTLRAALISGGMIATAVGIALGWWIAGRVLRPLGQVSLVAETIASGRLDTRLDTDADRDLARLYGSFNRMADSLKERIDREARFASDVAHELRSPLTTLMTSVSVLEHRRNELSDAGQEALELLVADINRFRHMVADLIEISQYDAGTVDVDLDVTQIGALVDVILERLRRTDIDVHLAPSHSCAMVEVDDRRLERAMSNLIENADNHAGGVSRIVVDAHAELVKIAVEDDGPGIDMADRERLFDRFARGAAGRRRSGATGTGLGLAIARQNVELVGGTLRVDDNPKGGSRFVISLPRVEP